MEGDFEDELRLAMAEHVRETSASHGLAAAVTRRFRRRIRRQRLAMAAVVAVAAVAVLPVYHAFGPAGTPVGPGMNAAESTTPIPEAHRHSSPQPRTGRLPTSRPTKPGGKGGPSAPAIPSIPSSPVSPSQVVAMGHLPAGMRATGPCSADRAGSRLTTSCQWSGAGGAVVDLHVIKDPSVSGLADFGHAFVLPRSATVDGRNGLVGGRLDGGSEAVWMDRPGVVVDLSVSAPLRDQLIQIANGVQVP